MQRTAAKVHVRLAFDVVAGNSPRTIRTPAL